MEFILDALLDSLKILPFLLIAYILIEVIEYVTADKLEHSKLLTGKWSNLFASAFGLVPQCGFSVVATDLFASKKLKIGTLLAVYIATSDEAVPILLTNPDKILSLLPLLAIKFVLAIMIGYSVDLIFAKANKKRFAYNNFSTEHHHHENNCHPSNEDAQNLAQENETHNHNDDQKQTISEQNVPLNSSSMETHMNLNQPIETDKTAQTDHSKHEEDHDHHGEIHHHGCCGHEIESTSKKDLWKRFLLHPLFHTLKIFAFILVVNLVMGGVLALVGEQALIDFLNSSNAFAPLISAIIGLIPNCASSVVITELFAMGGIGFGACMAGLIVNAGIAFVVLFKENKNYKENFAILGGLFAIGVATGYIIQLIGF